jgi:hypothetical protein
MRVCSQATDLHAGHAKREGTHSISHSVSFIFTHHSLVGKLLIGYLDNASADDESDHDDEPSYLPHMQNGFTEPAPRPPVTPEDQVRKEERRKDCV